MLRSVLIVAAICALCGGPGFAQIYSDDPCNNPNEAVWHEGPTVAQLWRDVCAKKHRDQEQAAAAQNRPPEPAKANTDRAALFAALQREQEQRDRLNACTLYGSVASGIVVRKNAGMSYKDAALWAASQAYGPNGEVFVASESNADAMMALAAAAYFARDKYGRSDQMFLARAYRDCLQGKLLDASEAQK